MKKLFVVLAVSAFVFSFSSCKKDYTCDCTWKVLDQTETSSSPIENAKKSDAEDACDALQVTARLVDASATCELK